MALIINAPLLDVLRIDIDTPLQVSTNGKILFIEPISDPAAKARFQARARARKPRKRTGR